MIGGVWQGHAMTDPSPQAPAPVANPSPQAGGFVLIVCILVGTAIGIWQRQPSIGVLGGAVVGTLIALALWWRDRARAGR